MERHVTFECEDCLLEGRYYSTANGQTAVITHPHPRYGGDMHNPVVEAVATAYQQNGWGTLRFNFRGTGDSQGSFDNGRDEQKDIDAAIAYLNHQGAEQIELAGYSFGAWVLARWAGQSGQFDQDMRFVAPPVALLDFDGIEQILQLKQIVVGSLDDFAPRGRVETLTGQWNPEAELNIIDGADHFFWNSMDSLRNVIEEAIAKKNAKDRR